MELTKNSRELLRPHLSAYHKFILGLCKGQEFAISAHKAQEIVENAIFSIYNGANIGCFKDIHNDFKDFSEFEFANEDELLEMIIQKLEEYENEIWHVIHKFKKGREIPIFEFVFLENFRRN